MLEPILRIKFLVLWAQVSWAISQYGMSKISYRTLNVVKNIQKYFNFTCALNEVIAKVSTKEVFFFLYRYRFISSEELLYLNNLEIGFHQIYSKENYLQYYFIFLHILHYGRCYNGKTVNKIYNLCTWKQCRKILKHSTNGSNSKQKQFQIVAFF